MVKTRHTCRFLEGILLTNKEYSSHRDAVPFHNLFWVKTILLHSAGCLRTQKEPNSFYAIAAQCVRLSWSMLSEGNPKISQCVQPSSFTVWGINIIFLRFSPSFLFFSLSLLFKCFYLFFENLIQCIWLYSSPSPKFFPTSIPSTLCLYSFTSSLFSTPPSLPPSFL